MTTPATSNGHTRLAYILGVPLAPDCQRQWPQLGEVVRGADLIGQVEGNFPELTLEVGRRLQLDDIVVVGVGLQLRRRTPLSQRHHRRTPRRSGHHGD